MNVLSLFAGIGGLDLGLEWAGFRTIAFVERDPACQHWLKQHWPAVPIHGDIHTFSGEPLRGLVDLVCGGFPCQPFSVAGKQKGTEDDRHLWPEMSRIIREVRPRWVLAENVPGLRTIAADLVLEDLEGQGYTCWPLVVGADDVGAPHRRKRVWIIGRKQLAHGHGHGREGERRSGLLDGQRTTFGDHADGCGERNVADTPGRGLGTDGRTSRRSGHPDLSESPVGEPTGAGLEGQRPDAGEPQEPEPRHSGAMEYAEGAPRFESPDESDSGAVKGRGGDGSLGPSPRWPSRPGEPQHPWEAPRLAYTERQRRGGRSMEATAGHGPEPQEQSGRNGMADSASEPPRSPGQPRQDTDPREPESPMGGAVDGLPDRLDGLSSSHRREALKALGNAVSPPCAYYIGRAILKAEQERTA